MRPAEPAEFAEFVAQRSAALLRVAWLLTGDSGRAEDLLQTTLAKVWPRWHRIVSGNPDAYVRRVLFSTFLSWQRRRWRFEVPHAFPPERGGRQDVAADSANRDAVRRALAGLSGQQRAVVVLRYVEDLSVEDTADVLGCSSATVRVQAGRALAALRVNPHVNPPTSREVLG
jgi:RNA polymerase sigma-70 factor (sigma-E family)